MTEKQPFHSKRPVVICGPSGVGKGTLMEMLILEFKQFKFAASHTSRSPRPGEVDKVHYNFVTRESFEEKIREGGFFLEHTEYNGNLYGIALPTVRGITEGGDICVMDLDITGCQNVKKSDLNAFFIFIEPPEPKFETLKKRLQGRATEPPEAVEKRINRAKEELEWKERNADFFDATIVNEDKNIALLVCFFALFKFAHN